jgi:hypothetical protein
VKNLRNKHQLKTTAKFLVEQLPIVGTIAQVPDYINEMKNPKIVFVIKTKEFMGEYIALNWLEPILSKKFKIGSGEVFVRSDWWKNKAKKYRIQVHEKVEIYLRENFNFNYEQAHKLATRVEHIAIENKGWELDKVIKHI